MTVIAINRMKKIHELAEWDVKTCVMNRDERNGSNGKTEKPFYRTLLGGQGVMAWMVHMDDRSVANSSRRQKKQNAARRWFALAQWSKWVSKSVFQWANGTKRGFWNMRCGWSRWVQIADDQNNAATNLSNFWRRHLGCAMWSTWKFIIENEQSRWKRQCN